MTDIVNIVVADVERYRCMAKFEPDMQWKLIQCMLPVFGKIVCGRGT